MENFDPDYTTLTRIGHDLKIPINTLRYYRDNYIDFLPYRGKGKSRRYKYKECIQIFSIIREMYNQHRTSDEIRSYLAAHFPTNADAESTTDNNQPQPFKSPYQQLDELKGFIQELNSNYIKVMERLDTVEKQNRKLAEENKRLVERSQALTKQQKELEFSNQEFSKTLALLRDKLEQFGVNLNDNEITKLNEILESVEKRVQENAQQEIERTDQRFQEKLNEIKRKLHEREQYETQGPLRKFLRLFGFGKPKIDQDK